MILHFNNHLNFLGTLDGTLISRCSTLIKSFGPGNQGPVNLCLASSALFSAVLRSGLQEKPMLLFISWEVSQDMTNMWLQPCMRSTLYYVAFGKSSNASGTPQNWMPPFSMISSSENTRDYKQFMTQRRSSPRLLLFTQCLLHSVSASLFSRPDTLDIFTPHRVRCGWGSGFKCII